MLTAISVRWASIVAAGGSASAPRSAHSCRVRPMTSWFGSYAHDDAPPQQGERARPFGTVKDLAEPDAARLSRIGTEPEDAQRIVDLGGVEVQLDLDTVQPVDGGRSRLCGHGEPPLRHRANRGRCSRA
jgi:hypothetical protein